MGMTEASYIMTEVEVPQMHAFAKTRCTAHLLRISMYAN